MDKILTTYLKFFSYLGANQEYSGVQKTDRSKFMPELNEVVKDFGIHSRAHAIRVVDIGGMLLTQVI